MFFADIGLFQMCAGILNRTSPDTFVPISLERFGLTSYFDWQQVSNVRQLIRISALYLMSVRNISQESS
jgi:hypothetical protein